MKTVSKSFINLMILLPRWWLVVSGLVGGCILLSLVCDRGAVDGIALWVIYFIVWIFLSATMFDSGGGK